MITGQVFDRQATVRLRLLGRDGRWVTLAFAIDTAFTAALAVPGAVVARLGLSFANYLVGRLADGTRQVVEVYTGSVDWHGEIREVDILASGPDPLLGTELLDGSELTIEFRDAGAVTIRPFLVDETTG